ncbi:hypothetical protein QTO34_008584 [Cnephaeus nilssonii]|uniref:Transforming acidic coiled-coil-containing protein C-terminal domain-containing protein n=1 Tax=Cnephaeus nilssonii TaxID=3371016 RepID=A0AA40IBQ9_CNENI|nr:hypothetical protein QTO34_008584 [Eptesicus nilssonii]
MLELSQPGDLALPFRREPRLLQSQQLPPAVRALSPQPLPPTQRPPEPAWDPREEHFQDAAAVLGMGVDVDYLEQFGTSQFKESALRKQSLYLKFDPLLKDSPERPAPAAPTTSSAPGAEAPSGGGPPEGPLVDLDFPAGPGLAVPPPPCVLRPGGPLVDVLQYSQRDLDAAVEAAQKEVLQLRSQCEELHQKNLEMGKVMDGYESFMYQAMEEAQKQQELAKAEIQKVLKEKDQLSTDLSSMEKSFSDLFKRFEKQKEAIEGYRTAGAALPTESWSLKRGTWRSLALRWAVRPASPVGPGQADALVTAGTEEPALPSEEAWPGPPQRPKLGTCRSRGPQGCGEGSSAAGQARGARRQTAIGVGNEESLKKCVEDYIVRVQKEGQRYQALKAHAEEKLRLANEEIAQVRSKAQAEALAFQASLRKEQMRVQSLEKAVEQKVGAGLRPGSGRDVPLWFGTCPVRAPWPAGSQAGPRSSSQNPLGARPGATWAPAATSEHWEMEGLTFLFQTKENDELTRICDDLISKMEKI